MTPSAPSQHAACSLRLLDAASGRPVQVWNFANQALVRIGRLDENDVVVVDPHVSRLHAELHYQDGGWQLKSLGRNGVVIDDQRVESVAAREGLVFRLGIRGPTLSFSESGASAVDESEAGRSTYQFDMGAVELLGIDQGKTEEQVRQIMQESDFERLLEQARALRARRSK